MSCIKKWYNSFFFMYQFLSNTKPMQKIITFSLGLLIANLFFTNALMAQNFAVGHMEKHYIDAARSNRDVWTEVYFPATTADTSVAAAGTFPTIVFGHGFAMAWSNYDYLWKYFVARGYVCVFPRTEGSIFGPSHPNFGGDLRFLSNLFGNVLNTQTGKLQGHLTTKTAIAGHSMGGGAAFLGGANNTQVATMVTFAAAQTNPRSSTAAYNVTCPNLVISGEKDCVAKVDSQLIMYNSLTGVPHKYYVSLKEGTHCNFASQSSVCEAGQLGTCGSLARAAQNARVLSLTEPWFNFHLKGDCSEFTRFKDTVNAMVTSGYATKQNVGDPLPTVSIVQNGSTLTATTIGTSTYAWSNGSTTATTTVGASGTYTVTVTRTANGCTATANIIFTGVENENDAFANISIYPNPTQNDFTIENLPTANYEINVFDAMGRLLQTTKNNTSTQRISLAEYANGLYRLVIVSASGTKQVNVYKQ
jgi:predicted dienelactone hydrolase